MFIPKSQAWAVFRATGKHCGCSQNGPAGAWNLLDPGKTRWATGPGHQEAAPTSQPCPSPLPQWPRPGRAWHRWGWGSPSSQDGLGSGRPGKEARRVGLGFVCAQDAREGSRVHTWAVVCVARAVFSRAAFAEQCCLWGLRTHGTRPCLAAESRGSPWVLCLVTYQCSLLGKGHACICSSQALVRVSSGAGVPKSDGVWGARVLPGRCTSHSHRGHTWQDISSSFRELQAPAAFDVLLPGQGDGCRPG